MNARQMEKFMRAARASGATDRKWKNRLHQERVEAHRHQKREPAPNGETQTAVDALLAFGALKKLERGES